MDKDLKNQGAQDPELKNSPIADETDEDFDVLRQELEDGVCYFNGQAFGEGECIRSGSSYLRCDDGLWVPAGSVET
jgi:hypothetical protein